MRLNAVLARTAALCAQRDTELAPHARDAPIAARRTFTAAQATLGQDGVSASNARPALTQFARAERAALAGRRSETPSELAGTGHRRRHRAGHALRTASNNR
ncbi:hypothetical protein WJ30_24030 [Burkholderia diffusa]|nr:hypothetical protein WJ30_24030 [Burkholderia diffusa]